MDRNGKVPIFPNAFPYNDLLLSGKLLAKTRNWKWDYRGPVLLYTSSRNTTPVWQAYDMPPRNYPHKQIVGRGNLVDCRPLTNEEWWTITRQFNPTATDAEIERRKWNLIWPMQYGFFFEDLVRFEQPVAFNWPSGAILPIWRTIEEMEGLLATPPILKINPVAEIKSQKIKKPEKWIELTDEYLATIKHLSRRKIRLPWNHEVSAYWDKEEGCFFWNDSEEAVYVDQPGERPTHIRVG